MSFVQELKRRNVIRVAIAYVVSAWLLIQVAETIFPLFGFDEGPTRVIVIVLAIGFPLTLIFSWIYELTPDGLKLEREIDRSGSMTHHTGKKLDRAIIVVLTLALGYFAFDKFILDPARDVTLEETVTERVRDEMLIESYGEKSIAVLPFVNMSDDASNEYFSDGISEEVLNLLAGISELRVISRSSAFAFKGRNVSIPSIAEQLNVAYVLEGSVRKAGKTVRITAQLIEANTDTHLWSETFDRNLDDVFAVQDEIAAAVVEKLRVTLLRDVPEARPTDPETYALYLQAKYVMQQQTISSLELAEQLFKKSLAIDPTYFYSWLGLAKVYSNQTAINQLSVEKGESLMQEAIEKAQAIEPDSAQVYLGLGYIASIRDGDMVMSARHIQRALQLEPHSIDVLANVARILQDLGRLNEAIIVQEYIVARDPIDPKARHNLGIYYLNSGQFPQAKASFLEILALSPDYVGARYFIGLTDLFMGDAEASLESFEQEPDDEWRLKGLALANFSLGRGTLAESSLNKLMNDWGEEWPSEIAHVYSFRGELDSAFRWLEDEEPGAGNWAAGKLDPLLRNLHADPRWQDFLERRGVSDAQLAEIDFQVSLPALEAP